MTLSKKLVRLDAFAAGILIGLSIVTPAFAAAFDNPLPPRDWLLMGSLVLLAVGIALRLMRHRTTTDAGPIEPDLRWWRQDSLQ